MLLDAPGTAEHRARLARKTLSDEPKPGPPPDVQVFRGHLREAWREVWTSEPFGAVLLLVFASFVFLSSAPDTEWARIISIALQGATLLLALRAAEIGKKYQRAAAVIVALALLSSVVAVVGPGEDVSEIFVRLVAVMLVAVAPVVIAGSVIRSILRQKRVTLQAIFGVVSIYLLLGLLFAFCYSAIDSIDGSNFFAQNGKPDIQDFVYFSFVTLTTVGYGDLTAAASNQVGRTFAIVEALLGQLYLITVLSVFVGNLRPRRISEQ
jgi:hypothetical protein